MKLLQDKGMEPHPQNTENENVLEHSCSDKGTVMLAPSTNRFNLLTISDEEES